MKKIAFLFLVPSGLNQTDLWERYLKGNEKKYVVYTHPYKSFVKDRVLKNTQINKIVKTSWGTTFEAIMELLKTAYNNKDVSHAILCSESCVPIKSFDELYKFIMKQNKIVVNLMKMKEIDITHKFIPGVNEMRKKYVSFQFPKKYLLKHNANWCMPRKYISELLNSEKIFLDFFKIVSNQDELFLSLLLMKYKNKSFIKDFPLFFSDWEYMEDKHDEIVKKGDILYKEYKKNKNEKMKKKIQKLWTSRLQFIDHPRVFNHVTPEMFKELQSKKSFFVRKFHKDSNIGDYF